jgi:hypothetical protein
VSQHTAEQGASGQRRRELVVHQFASPIGIGLLVGIGGAAVLSQVLRQEIDGFRNFDPAAYTGAVIAFVTGTWVVRVTEQVVENRGSTTLASVQCGRA